MPCTDLLRRPWVLVTPQGPDDGGDFGPCTPGTRTSGIQEALDHAHTFCREVYICGGRGGLHQGEGVARNIYALAEAERLPHSLPHNLSLVDNLRRPPRPAPPSQVPLSQTIHAGLFPGQSFILEPGEKVQFLYTQPPAWRWKALT